MTKIPLDTPITAYFVNVDCIVPIEIKHRFTETTYYASFRSMKAVWIKERTTPWISNGERCFLTISPSNKGRPFEHSSMAYSIEEAIVLLQNQSLVQAQYHRKEAQRCIDRATKLETTNYRDLVLGDKESYVSIFTGKKK